MLWFGIVHVEYYIAPGLMLYIFLRQRDDSLGFVLQILTKQQLEGQPHSQVILG